MRPIIPRWEKERTCFCIGYIPSTSYGNTYVARHHLDKHMNFKPPKLRLYQLTQNINANIAPHIFSDLRDLGMNFYKSIFSRSPILAGSYRLGNVYLWYGTENEQKNTQNNLIEVDIRIEMTLYTYQNTRKKLKQLPICLVNWNKLISSIEGMARWLY